MGLPDPSRNPNIARFHLFDPNPALVAFPDIVYEGIQIRTNFKTKMSASHRPYLPQIECLLAQECDSNLSKAWLPTHSPSKKKKKLSIFPLYNPNHKISHLLRGVLSWQFDENSFAGLVLFINTTGVASLVSPIAKVAIEASASA